MKLTVMIIAFILMVCALIFRNKIPYKTMCCTWIALTAAELFANICDVSFSSRVFAIIWAFFMIAWIRLLIMEVKNTKKYSIQGIDEAVKFYNECIDEHGETKVDIMFDISEKKVWAVGHSGEDEIHYDNESIVNLSRVILKNGGSINVATIEETANWVKNLSPNEIATLRMGLVFYRPYEKK